MVGPGVPQLLRLRPLPLPRRGRAHHTTPGLAPGPHPGRGALCARPGDLSAAGRVDRRRLAAARGRRPAAEPGGGRPRGATPAPVPAPPVRDDFDAPALAPYWNTLRTPATPQWLSLTERPGHLRLRGRQSPHSRYALRLTHEECRGRVLGIVLTDDGAYGELPGCELDVDDWPLAHLRARFDGPELRFAASPDGVSWQDVGPALEATRLSDDYGERLRFTGAFVGVCVQDLGGTRAVADFDWFELRDLAP
ncbi:hypothetical protein AB0B32_28620 [Streptomyces sparsogenes]